MIDPHDTEMSFGDHLEALRPHLVRSFGMLILLAIAAFCLKGFLVDVVIFGPTLPDFPTNLWLSRLGDAWGIEELKINSSPITLINTSMAGQFNLHLKLSIMTAIIVGFPYLGWELWRFIKPALTERELRGCRFFVGWLSLGFFSGVAFGYFIIAPLAINFLTGYSVSSTINNYIDISSYLSTVVDISIACAVVFQLPLLVYFLTKMGILSASFMVRYRRHAFIALALLSALITPPDVFSMVLILIPLYGLYEGSISLSKRVEKREANNP